MNIRPEGPHDAPAIRSLTTAAFEGLEHSSQTEAAIVDALRRSDALAISLVAVRADEIVGHVAFSPVLIDGVDHGWFGLGPVSVLPNFQNGGVGTALIEEGLRRLVDRGAGGCVLLGDPAYYRRFGFSNDHALRYGGAPPQYFQSLAFSGGRREGEVTYHPGFDAG